VGAGDWRQSSSGLRYGIGFGQESTTARCRDERWCRSQARLGRLLRRGHENPDRKAAALCRERTKWWAALWTLARVEGVEPTNSVSEPALRPTVLWRTGSFGSDSEAGSRFAEPLIIVVASCRRQGGPLLDCLVTAGEAAARGSPSPSQLSAPRWG